MSTLSRRDFLKLTGLASLGLAFSPTQPALDPFYTLGRIATPYLRVYNRPSVVGKQVDWLGFDEIARIYDNLTDDDGQLWYELGNGYIQSSEVQPVANRLNPAVAQIPASGNVGEITVPYTDVRRQALKTAGVVYRLYYGATTWLKELVSDPDGQPWYKVYDERLGIQYFAPAAHIRLVPDAETAPLNPNTTEKKIVVNLKQQRLYAYEGTQEVFTTLISAGRLYLASDGTTRSWTPSGNFQVERKKPSRHMGQGEAAGSDYELPGVPWVSYFHWKGFSFHGTWWHNDYGHPRSSGCVNMRPEEALWVYRWSRPTALPDQELTTGLGTAVEIVED